VNGGKNANRNLFFNSTRHIFIIFIFLLFWLYYVTMRKTIRFNAEEEAEIKLLIARCGVGDLSQAVKFAVKWTLDSFENVTGGRISAKYDVKFSRRVKYHKPKKIVYE